MSYKMSFSMDELKAGFAVLSEPETKAAFKQISFESVKNNFLDVVKNRYFCFEGNASRAEFWQFYLVCVIINAIGLGIFVALPLWGVGARRLHEVGKSGWVQLYALIPFVGWLIPLALWMLKPVEGCGCGCGCEQK